MTGKSTVHKCVLYSLLVLFMLSSLPGCSSLGLVSLPSQSSSEPVTNIILPPVAEVDFIVEVPSLTPDGEAVYLDVLDEVTGLGLNPLRYSMQQIDRSHFAVRVPLTVGSVVKYRYSRGSSQQAIEYTGTGVQVRYRLFSVPGKTELHDSVSAWSDMPYSGLTGRIEGRVTDAATNAPVPNVLITAGGSHTMSSADGSFLLEGMSLATHNLVAYSLDGTYATFQQGALVAAESSTPAPIQMVAKPWVGVTFVVQVPQGSISGLPIRLIGNTYSTGNTFADLEGGISSVASRAPLLSLVADNVYSLTMYLPSGLDFRYKYSLGDGFWNAEQAKGGGFRVRQLIVPESDFVVQDKIETWSNGSFAPITFTANIPGNTPVSDTVSVQFNPYGWMEPIPMWPIGNNQWLYILYSPLEMVDNVGYRFCRNDRCDSAGQNIMVSMNAMQEGVFLRSKDAQDIQSMVQGWAWWQFDGSATTVATAAITPRPTGYVTGVELQANYHPAWQPYLGFTFQNIVEMGANRVVLTPTWSYTRVNLPVLEAVPGRDALWYDITQMNTWALQRNLSIILFPHANFDVSSTDWWASTVRDAGWWKSWQDRYRTFILHHAEMASVIGAPVLVLGEPGMLPALPGGKLPDGRDSGAPSNMEEYWKSLISEVRMRYGGTLAWAVPYPFPGGIANVPAFVADVDQFYVLWSADLTDSTQPTTEELRAEIARMLDADIHPLLEKYGKPMTMGINYPSVDGAATACILENGVCSDFRSLDQPRDVAGTVLDLQEQVDIYNAVMLAVNERDWISGVVSRGYYPPLALRDKSASIHGKPAEDVLRYWYPRLQGIITE